jgi:DNA-binding MarR family transcriptional regulator
MADASRKMLDEIADGLMVSLPMFFRKVSRDEGHPGGKAFDPSRFVLHAVMTHRPVRMTEICKRTEISKPYMTAIVNKLIEEGFVERVSDPDDRRVVNINITDAGRKEMKEFARRIRDAVIKNLSSLSSEDISALHESITKIRNITSKLDKGEPGECRCKLG